MTRFLAITCAAILALVALVLGVGGCLERAGVQPEVRINPTTSYQVTQTPILYKTAQVTATPAPDYMATEQSIEVQALRLTQAVQDFNAELTRQAQSNNNEATQQAQAAINTLAKIDIEKATDNLNAAKTQHAQTTSFQATQQAMILEKEQRLYNSEIRSAEKLDEWNAVIKAAWLTLWRILGLLLGVAFVVWIFVKTSARGEYEADLLRMAREYEDALRNMEHQVTEKAQADALRYSQIRDYVRDAVKVAGGDYHQFPAASEPKMSHWHNDLRTQVVGYMKMDGAVYTNNTGTFVKRGTLAELLDDIERGEYPSPTTRESAPDAGDTVGTPKVRI